MLIHIIATCIIHVYSTKENTGLGFPWKQKQTELLLSLFSHVSIIAPIKSIESIYTTSTSLYCMRVQMQYAIVLYVLYWWFTH